MNLEQLITPTREDGGIDHRYTGLAKKIIEKTGYEAIHRLQQFYNRSSALESEYDDAALRLVAASFTVELDKWQKLRIKKQLRQCLQELGFKPSKVTKLLASGEFLAVELVLDYNSDIDGRFGTDEEAPAQHEEYCIVLNSYGVNALYEISKMNGNGLEILRKHHSSTGSQLSVRALQELSSEHRRAEDDWRKKLKENRLKEKKRRELIDQYNAKSNLTLETMDSNTTTLSTADPIQMGIDQIISGIKLLGSLDELSAIPHYLNQLKPHVINFEMLHSITVSKPDIPLRNQR
jgi:hypothetical protein